MPSTTDRQETSEDVVTPKSVADLEREYQELLKEYERLTGEVDTQIRHMRGGRLVKWNAILERILNRKTREVSR